MPASAAVSVLPAKKIYKATKHATNMLAVAGRAVCCGTAGTCTFLDGEGNLCTDYPMQAGYNPIEITALRTGGTADNIWVLC
jgi:hypothetical protein